MVVDENPYWNRKPSGAVLERLYRIADLTRDTVRTVRNITYRLYPDLHGRALERAYNTTVKDVVRGRLMGLVPWENIRENRVSRRNPEGYEDRDTFVESLIDPGFWRGYRRSRRPAHLRALEVWYEKDTVEPEFSEVCRRYDVPYLSTRGQLTWTAKRNVDRLPEDHLVLYFGDNDEKGHEIREVIERDAEFLGYPIALAWVAVTPVQERRFGLPVEARLDGFELDDLRTVIEEEILRWVDVEILREIEEREEEEIDELRRGRLRYEAP